MTYTVTPGSYSAILYPFLLNKMKWEGQESFGSIVITDPEIPSIYGDSVTISAMDCCPVLDIYPSYPAVNNMVHDSSFAMHVHTGVQANTTSEPYTMPLASETVLGGVQGLAIADETIQVASTVGNLMVGSGLSLIGDGTICTQASTNLKLPTYEEIMKAFKETASKVVSIGSSPFVTYTPSQGLDKYYYIETTNRVEAVKELPSIADAKLEDLLYNCAIDIDTVRTMQICVPEDSAYAKRMNAVAKLNGKLVKVGDCAKRLFQYKEFRGSTVVVVAYGELQNTMIPLEYLK
jgi:hypothetical protein